MYSHQSEHWQTMVCEIEMVPMPMDINRMPSVNLVILKHRSQEF